MPSYPDSHCHFTTRPCSPIRPPFNNFHASDVLSLTVHSLTHLQEWDLLKAGKGENRKLDIVIVVGAFKSRRAKRLQHIAKIAKIQTYWIDSPSCINVERNAITWQDSRRRIGSTFGFLPHGETLVGIMPDSSISNRTLEEVMQKLYEIQNRDI